MCPIDEDDNEVIDNELQYDTELEEVDEEDELVNDRYKSSRFIDEELSDDDTEYLEDDEDDDDLSDDKEQKPIEELDPKKYGLKEEKAKNIYCKNEELIAEIRKYQEDGIATNKLGELIIKIAIHMSTMSRFYRYSHAIKEELVDHAILQMFLSIPKFDLSNEKANPFGYLSMISYRDMLHTLKKHFKQTKIRDELAMAYLSKMSSCNNDDRMNMLRASLERNEEYNNFIKNEKMKGERQVDTFALSRTEQERRAKLASKDTHSK